jgi:NADPH-dependent F420 reductase
MPPENELPIIAILGGTGKQGKGLAFRWAKAGYKILLGSRTLDKASMVANEILDRLGGKASVEGTTNRNAARIADIIVLTVPYAAHRSTLEDIKDDIQGKVLLDVTVPLSPPMVTKVQMPPDGSAAQEACAILGNNVQVASAFQNISFTQLLSEEMVDHDVLVTGTSKTVRTVILQLVAAAGLNGWDAGPIENSSVIEGLTSVLIYINKQYGSRNAGVKIVGVNKELR